MVKSAQQGKNNKSLLLVATTVVGVYINTYYDDIKKYLNILIASPFNHITFKNIYSYNFFSLDNGRYTFLRGRGQR